MPLRPAIRNPVSAGFVALGFGIACPTSGVAQELPSADDILADISSAVVRLDEIRVGDIRVLDVSVFSESELDQMVAAYENRSLRIEELHELRQALSAAYVKRGFVNSGVVIPDQRVANGEFTFQAIEGELGQIEISGLNKVNERSIERRIRRNVERPLHIADLGDSLEILERDPLIERINAELLPGNLPGQAILRMGITEASPWELRVNASNYRSPSVGEHRGTVGLAYRGLIGNGDELVIDLGVTEGVSDNAISYNVPIGSGGTSLNAYYAEQDLDIVEQPFSAIDITSRLESWGIQSSRTLMRGSLGTLGGSLGFEHKRSQSTLLGIPFSFSRGDVDGRARSSAVLAGINWSRQTGRSGWSGQGILRIGVDALDATQAVSSTGIEALPDSDFVSLQGRLQYVRQLTWRAGRVSLVASFQRSDDALLGMEKFPVGGRFSVRGYRESQFVRDNGAAVSVEYRFPLLVNEARVVRSGLDLALFADYGLSWDEDDELATASKARVASSGVGLLWAPHPSVSAEVFWAHAFDDVSVPETSSQDRGWHYQIVFQKSF